MTIDPILELRSTYDVLETNKLLEDAVTRAVRMFKPQLEGGAHLWPCRDAGCT